jgi:hypothetical protein
MASGIESAAPQGRLEVTFAQYGNFFELVNLDNDDIIALRHPTSSKVESEGWVGIFTKPTG